MFAPYSSLDKYVGKEVQVRAGGLEYRGVLAGLYAVQGVAMLVLVPTGSAAGHEQHIPLAHAVVTVATA